MLLVHFAGAPDQTYDEYKVSRSFTEFTIKMGYTFELKSMNSGIELFGGVKNFTNAFQDDFDTGKNRDSNYVYGPGAPRTYFIGLRLRSL
jgi:outer membrane receptor for ferrienterochelin and colicins